MVLPRFFSALALLLIYGFLTLVGTIFLDPGMTPPGYTGRGLLGLLVLIAGCFHSAKYTRAYWLFLLVGALAAWFHVKFYISDARLGIGLSMGMYSLAHVTWRAIALMLIAFFPPYLAAKLRWYIQSRVTDPSGFPVLCPRCHQELHANHVCP